MQEQKNLPVKRIVCASVIIIVATLLIFAHIEIHRGVNYSGQGPTVSNLTHQAESTPDPIEGIDEPEHLNHVIHLTLGGSCTPAAVLGSNSFGTFNLMAEEEEKTVFFKNLNRIFTHDDCTVLGCAAVLSDNALELDDINPDDLPAIGPTSNAEVFSLSGADVISVAHARSNSCGEAGLADTKASLTEAGLNWIDAENAFFADYYGFTVGILSAQIPADTDSKALREAITAASEASDYLVLYAEREEAESTYYTDLAHTFIDAGCDVVCYTGYAKENGPSAEVYNNGIIVDSLGYLLDGSIDTAADTALYDIALSVKDGVIEQVKGTLIPVTYEEGPWIPKTK